MLLEFHVHVDADHIDPKDLSLFVSDARRALVREANKHGGLDEGMQDDYEHHFLELYSILHGNYHQPWTPGLEWPTYRDADRVLLAMRTELGHLNYRDSAIDVFRLNSHGQKTTKFMLGKLVTLNTANDTAPVVKNFVGSLAVVD